jgi:hypothetical protein
MPYTHNRRRPWASLGLTTLALLGGLGGLGVEAHGQTFGLRIIEPIPGHNRTTSARVSADGSVLGYTSSVLSGGIPTQGIVERDGVLTSISTYIQPFSRSTLNAVSGTGVFGAGGVPVSGTSSRYQPAHYDFDNQRITPIGLPSDDFRAGYSTGISHSGDVVVGRFEEWETPRASAFRWTAQSGVQLLQPGYTGDREVFAYGVSGDGNTVVGVSQDAGRGVSNAMRWDATGTGVRLPSLDGDYFTSTIASGISADGRIVAGSSDTSWFGSAVAVVWDEDNQIRRLSGDLLETALGSQAWAANADGTVIGGVVTMQRNTIDAMIWTEQTQGMLLSDYLALFGINVPSGVLLHNVSSISADGRTIGGNARVNGNERAYVVHIPSPSGVAMFAAGLMFAGGRRWRGVE